MASFPRLETAWRHDKTITFSAHRVSGKEKGSSRRATARRLCAKRGEEKTAAVMGTGIGDDEQSAPVKERQGSRGRLKEGQIGRAMRREKERERERERDWVVITAESFCRGIFQNDWAL